MWWKRTKELEFTPEQRREFDRLDKEFWKALADYQSTVLRLRATTPERLRKNPFLFMAS